MARATGIIDRVEIKVTYYLVEIIDGSEYNIYSGTEQECKDEMSLQQDNYKRLNRECKMYISCNRFS